MNLVPSTDKEIIRYEYEELQKAAKSSQYRTIFSSSKFDFIRKLFSLNGKKKLDAAAATNDNRSVIEPKTTIDAQLPDENLSDPDDFAKINNAGLLFIKLGECPPIYKFSRNFIQRFKPLSNTVSLVNTIISSLDPILATTSDNGFIGISIEPDALRVPLLQCFTTFLKSKPTKAPKKYEWQSPLIIKGNAVAWLKCDLDITVKGCYGRKIIEADLNCYTFYFPTVEDFNAALMEAEKKDAEGTLL